MSFPNTYQNTCPPTSDPCLNCAMKKFCEERDDFCYSRARWWDVQMKKIQKKLEVNKSEG